jgi:NTP pyrophosphatase (non-canonical NTP hydrolase)
MDFKDIIKQIENFGCDHASYWGNALAGETGEACNLIKKIERAKMEFDHKSTQAYLSHRQRLVDKLRLELADVFIYAELTAQFFNIDLEQAILDKLEIIEYKRGKRLCTGCKKNPVTNFDFASTGNFWCNSCLSDHQI